MPKANLITMGMILHDWNLEKKMHLIRPVYEALPQGVRSLSSRTSSMMRGGRTPLAP